MSSIKLKICAAALVASLGATPALANQTGTFMGPYGSSQAQARANAVAVANGYCQNYGGLQSVSYLGYYPGPAGTWAAYTQYTCNN